MSVSGKGDKLRIPKEMDSVFINEVSLPMDESQPALVGRLTEEMTDGMYY